MENQAYFGKEKSRLSIFPFPNRSGVTENNVGRFFKEIEE
jgi:hypothetical protein